MAKGRLIPAPAKEETTPDEEILPTALAKGSVNQTVPFGPAAMPMGSDPTRYLDTAPPVVIRPMESFPVLVNHREPSEPAVMFWGYSMPVPG